MKFLLLLTLLAGCGPILPIDNPFRQPAQTPSVNLENPVEAVQSLRILVLDVGQGDATLVIGPSGRTLLIDGGPPDIGGAVALSTLNEEDIGHLDWVVSTHYDIDHLGGLPTILASFEPSLGVLDRGQKTTQDDPLFILYQKVAGSRRREVAPGELLDLGDGATAEVILVNGHYSDGRSIHLNPDEENEASIVLLIRYGEFEYLTTGDLTGGGAPGGYESKNLETMVGQAVGDIDILHAGHHGSSTSTNEGFLSLTRPEEVVISVGRENRYGHPTQEVLTRLSEMEAGIFRTDQMGTIEIVSDGSEYRITSQQR